MSDAFVSYQREDQERADLVVKSLSSEGLAVWWDQMIPPGANWTRTIETEIVQARSVVVLWSNASVASENVHCEAEFARSAGILVPGAFSV